MGMITKHYILVHSASGLMASYVSSSYPEGGAEVPPTPGEGEIVRDVTELLGSLSLQEFFNQKKAVVSSGEFSHWENRHSGLGMTLSATPKNDGSNTPFVSMEDGLPGSKYRAVPCAGIALNSSSVGTLDGTGNGTFRVKVTDGALVAGSLAVFPDGHQDFVPTTFEFIVEAGDF